MECSELVSWHAVSNCRDFDFTISFESYLLSLLPSLILLSLSLPILYSLLPISIPPIPILSIKTPPHIPRKRVIPTWKESSSLGWFGGRMGFWGRWMFGIVGIGVMLAWVGVWSGEGIVDESRGRSVLVAGVLGVVAMFNCLLLSHFSHVYSLRPSPLLPLYLLCTILCDTVRLRTFALTLLVHPEWNPNNNSIEGQSLGGFGRDGRIAVVTVFAFGLGWKVVWFFGEEVLGGKMRRREILEEREKNGLGEKPLPLSTVPTFLSRITFAFFIPTLIQGNRKSLTMKNIGEIDEDLESEEVWKAGKQRWAFEIEKAKRMESGKGEGEMDIGSHHPLIRTLFFSFPGVIWGPFIPTILFSLAQVAQPPLVGDMTRFIGSYSTDSPEPVANGWGIAGAFFLVFLIYGITYTLQQFAVDRCASSFRGFFIEMVYRKALRVHIDVAKDTGAGVGGNLISADTERVLLALKTFHTLYSTLLITTIGLYILYQQSGLVFLSTLVSTIIYAFFMPTMARKIGPAQFRWSKMADARTKLMGSVLRNVKGIKVAAYDEPMIEKIGSARANEVKALKAFEFQSNISVTVLFWASNFVTMITLVTASIVSLVTKSDRYNLNTERMFTIISLLSIVTTPLSKVGTQYYQVNAAWASLKRIESFLLRPEKRFIKSSSLPTHAPTLSKEELPASSKTQMFFRNATYSSLAKTPLLHDITADLPVGGLTMVVGQVGSGKSLFLQAFMGELSLEGGEGPNLVRDGEKPRIAYCGQDPWLRTNENVRDNVKFLFGEDERFYWEVIKAVQLDVDFQVIKKGDLALASGLSGGQAARVALARALYSKADVFVLDDCFSALDRNTEAHVFNALFGREGLLKEKTVVMATNGVHRLRAADWIVAMSDCRVIGQGTFTQMAQSKSAATELYLQFVQDRRRSVHGNSPLSPSTLLDDVVEEKRLEESKAMEEENKKDDDQKDEFQFKKVPLKTYWYYFGSIGLLSFAIWVVVLVIVCVIPAATNLYQQAWASEMTRHPRHGLPGYLGGYIAMELLYLAAFAVCYYYAAVTFAPAVGRKIHDRVLNSVMNSPLSFFENNSFGKILNRFSQDTFVLDTEFVTAYLMFVIAALGAIASVILIIVSAPYVGLVVLALLVVMWLIQRFYTNTTQQLRRLDLGAKSPLNNIFAETIDPNGLQTIRAFGMQNVMRSINSKRLHTAQRPYFLLNVARKWLCSSIYLLVTVLNTALVIIAVLLRNSTSAALLGVALVQATTLTMNLNNLLLYWANVEICIVAIERLREYSFLVPEESQDVFRPPGSGPGKAKPTDVTKTVDGTIDFENVVVRYRPELDPVLKGVTFRIKAGERVGICGRTGSGKSTILATLFRILDTDAHSSIRVNGIDVSGVGRRRLRNEMTIIPQDPLILEMLTIRENLDPEGRKIDTEIWYALEKVGLKNFMMETMPQKLDTVIQGSTGSFSRGQRQLFALARAILRERKIVCLDEATSSVDHTTDQLVQETLRTSFKGCTILTIAHRIDTVLDYDNILVLDSGNLVEIGSPKELLRIKGGVFATMANQSRHKDSSERMSDEEQRKDEVEVGVNSEDVESSSKATPEGRRESLRRLESQIRRASYRSAKDNDSKRSSWIAAAEGNEMVRSNSIKSDLSSLRIIHRRSLQEAPD